jgi:hypothetical protein
MTTSPPDHGDEDSNVQPFPRHPSSSSPWQPPSEHGPSTYGGPQRGPGPYMPPPINYGPPPQVNYGPPTVQRPSNGVATAGGVCGIVGAALSWIPIVNLFSLVLAIIAAALGGVGLARANRYEKEGLPPAGRGMAITGIVLGAAGLLIALVVIAAVGTAFSTS